MDRDEVRARVLRYAYDARNKNRLQREVDQHRYCLADGMDFSQIELGKELGINKNDIIVCLKDLQELEYLVLYNALEGSGNDLYSGRITEKGIVWIEGPGLFTSEYVARELARADLDNDTKRELEELIKRFEESLEELKGIIEKAASVAEKNPKALGIVQQLTDLAGRFTAGYTKGLVES